jgi:hypothetical protein
MKPHKHAELIKAWADGAEIEVNMPDVNGDDVWEYFNGDWNEFREYRIKPEPKPDVISYVFCTKGGTLAWKYYQIGDANLKLTFDGETGELKSAEVIK